MTERTWEMMKLSGAAYLAMQGLKSPCSTNTAEG